MSVSRDCSAATMAVASATASSACTTSAVSDIKIKRGACSGTKCSASVDGLEVGARYIAAVTAVNEAGPSNPVSLGKIFLGPPSPPLGLGISQASTLLEGRTIVTLAWSPPADFGDGMVDSDPRRTQLLGYTLAVSVGDQEFTVDAGSSQSSVTIPVVWGAGIANLSIPGLAELVSVGPGAVIGFNVMAHNQLFSGPSETASSSRLLGLPSAPSITSTSEESQGISLRWRAPSDTGYGDASLSVTSYLVQRSLCASFSVIDTACATARLQVDGEALEAYLTGLPSTAVSYRVRVSARNALGLGQPSTPASQDFQFTPAITYPSSLPVWVGYADDVDEASVWGEAGPLSFITAKVWGFSSSLSQSDFTVSLALAGMTLSVNATGGATSGRQRTLFLEMPYAKCSLDVGECDGTVTISAFSKSVDLPVRYFAYARPSFRSMFPAQGSHTGGTLLSLTLAEPSGPRTRSAAGASDSLVYAAAHSSTLITLAFACGGSNITSQATLEAMEGDEYRLSTTVPPSPCGKSPSDIIVAVDGVDIGIDLPQFSYIGAKLLVTPGAASINKGSGGAQLSLTVINSPPPASLSDLSLTLEGAALVIDESSSSYDATTARLEMSAVAPEMDSSLAGILTLNVSFGSFSAEAPFEFIAPPQPAIHRSSLSVDGTAQEWLPLAESAAASVATISLRILDLSPRFGYAFESIALEFAGSVYQPTLTTRAGDDLDCVFRIDRGSQVSAASRMSVVASMVDGRVVATVDTFDDGAPCNLEVRDTSQPIMAAHAPSEGPVSGGTYVVACISGGVPAFGDASLVSLDGDSTPIVAAYSTDSASSSLTSSALWSLMVGQNDEIAKAYISALDVALEQASSLGIPGAILVIKMPLAQSAGAATASIEGAGGKSVSFSFSYAVNPAGAPVISSATTSTGKASSGMQGQVPLEVSLTNFPIIYSASDIEVSWESFGTLEVEMLQRSSSAMTSFTLRVPTARNPGTVAVNISSSSAASDVATLLFTYVDDRLPTIKKFSPNKVYNSGGDVVQVTLSRFPSGVAASDVSVSLSFADGSSSTAALACSTCLSKVNSAGEATLSFAAPEAPSSGAIGLASVSISAGNRAAQSFGLTYIAEPTVAPTVSSLEPSVGLCNGGTMVKAIIHNMRKTESASSIVLVFDGLALNSSSWSGMSVTSAYTHTTVSFLVPPADLPGTKPISLYHSQRPGLAAAGTFECADPSSSSLRYVYPDSATSYSSPFQAMVQVSIAKFGIVTDVSQVQIEVASASARRQGTQMTWASVDSIVSSATDKSLVQVELTASLPGTYEYAIQPCPDVAVCGAKRVNFAFTFFDPSLIRIESFSPVVAYTYGRTPMSFNVKNLNVSAALSDYVVEVGGTNTSLTSIVHGDGLASSSAAAVARIGCILPPRSLPTAVVVVPKLIYLGTPSASYTFPAGIALQRPPAMVISSIRPSTADLSSSTLVQITVDNFPGLVSMANLNGKATAEFWMPGGDVAYGRIASYKRLDESLDPADVQSVRFDIYTPVGAGVVEAIASPLRIYSNEFASYAVAESNGFKFVDASSPVVTSVSTAASAGLLSASAPMGAQSELDVNMDKIPTGVAKSTWTAEVGGSPVSIAGSSYDPASRSGVVSIVVPTSDAPGYKAGLIVFGSIPAACSSACCSTGTCSVMCVGVKTACFGVDYFDDALPSIVGDPAPVAGPSIGETQIELAVSLFPQTSSDFPAVAQFGDDAANLGQVSVMSYSPEESRIVIVSPPIIIPDGKASLTVDVALIPMSNTERAVVFPFTYFRPRVSVEHFSPSRGSDEGGATVFCDVAYFPFPADPAIFFGVGGLSPSSVQVWDDFSDARSSRISFVTPKTEPGDYTVTIRPFSCPEPCGSQVSFTFTQVDSSQPVLLAPVPSRGPLQSSSTISVRMDRFPNPASDMSVTFTESDGTTIEATQVSGPQFGSSGDDAAIAALSFSAASVVRAGTVQVTISAKSSQGAVKTASFQYSLYDSNVPRLVDISPSKFPTNSMANSVARHLSPTATILVSNLAPDLGIPSVRVVFDDTGDAGIVESVKSIPAAAGCTEDCMRSAVVVKMPPQERAGSRGITITAGSASVKGTAIYEAACDYDSYCGPTRVPDFVQVMTSPSISCLPQVCLAPESIGMPFINKGSGPLPRLGPLTGGTVVEVTIIDMPAMSASDIKATVSIGSRLLSRPDIVTWVQRPGSSLSSSVGILSLRMPSASPSTGSARVRVYTSISGILRETWFDYEYMPVISGAPSIIVSTSSSAASSWPPRIFETNDLEVTVTCSNVPRFEAPFDASLLNITVGNAGTPASDVAVISSSVSATTFSFSSSGPWPIGTVSVSFCHKSVAGCPAASFDATVEALPAPSITEVYPALVPSNRETAATVTVSHLPASNPVVSLSIVFADVRVTLDVLGFDLQDKACEHRACSVHKISVNLPPNPLGSDLGGLAVVELSSPEGASNSSVSYISEAEPIIVSVFPPSKQPLESAGSDPITIYLKNFPSASCKQSASCAEQAIAGGLKVYFGPDRGEVVASSLLDMQGLLSFSVLAPASGLARSVEATVYAQATSEEGSPDKMVPFDYEFSQPVPTLAPSEAQETGGTLITITALGWGEVASSISEPSDLSVTLCGEEARVLEVSEASSSSTHSRVVSVFVAPACSSSNSLVSGQISSASGASTSSFQVSYYPSPSIPPGGMSPSMGTVHGGDDCAITIQDVPPIETLADITVVFGGSQCVRGGDCSVTGFSNGLGSATILVRSPPSETAGDQIVAVTVKGRQAVETSFKYIRPMPSVVSVVWCALCDATDSRPCISAGLCTATGVPPTKGSVPISGQGVLTIRASNLPPIPYDTKTGLITSSGVLGADAAVSLDMGGTCALRRVVNSDAQSSILEFSLPSFDAPFASGSYTLSVSTRASPAVFKASFPLAAYDDSITASCSATEVPSNGGGQPITATLTNFYIAPGSSVSDSLLVTFGPQPAAAVELVSTSPSSTILSISPPSCPSCTAGPTTVDLVVAERGGARRVSTPMTFWASPSIVSASFHTSGSQVIIIFDQPTDRAGMMPGDEECGSVIAPECLSALASPLCVWTSDTELAVTLGPGATVLPGHTIGVLGVRSANGVSAESQAEATVSRPLVPRAPVVTLWGTTTVDRCTDVSVAASSSTSSRPLTYSWSSSDPTIAASLVGYTGATPSISVPEFDKEYTLMVTGRDFMGAESSVQSLVITKMSSPVPQLSFLPPSTSLYRDESIVLVARTAFSSCPIEQTDMTFSWRQAKQLPSEPDFPSSLLESASGPLLLIPEDTLEAGASYHLVARVSMAGDVSKASESSVQVTVLRRDLVASIAGGSGLETSSLKSLTLDGSASHDPDSDSAQLFYEWSCLEGGTSETDNSGANACLLRDESGVEIALPSTPILSLPAGVLSSGSFVFTLTVSSDAKGQTSASMPIAVSSDRLPIAWVRNDGLGTPLADGVLLTNANDDLFLSGGCDEADSSLMWSISPQPQDSIMSDSSHFPLGIASSSLKVAGGGSVLVPGNTYTATLSCTKDGLTGAANIKIMVNSPPDGDDCVACLVGAAGGACVKEGQAVVGQFEMRCDDWFDNDGRLSYQFGFAEEGAAGITWFGLMRQNMFAMGFPAGSIRFYARVIDAYGASSRISQDRVTVLPAGTSSRRSIAAAPDDFWTQVKELVASEVQLGNAEQVHKAVISAAIEAGMSVGNGTMLPGEAADLGRFMIDALNTTVHKVGAAATTEYGCVALSAVEKLVSAGGVVVNGSILDAAYLVSRLVSIDSTSALSTECSLSVSDTLSGLMLAFQDGGGHGSSLLNLVAETTRMSLRRASKAAAFVSMSLSSATATSSIERRAAGSIGTLSAPHPDKDVSAAGSFVVNSSLASSLNISTLDSLDVMVTSSSVIPGLEDGLFAVTPLQGLTLSLTSDGDASSFLSVSDLADPIRILLPITRQAPRMR